MMTPQLKGFDCLDLDPIDEWQPQEDEDVYYTLCLHIGLPNEDGADLFYVDVLTPQAMKVFKVSNQILTNPLIVSPYSWENVMAEVKTVLENCQGEHWSDISRSLSKRFNWEFANYQSYKANEKT